MSALIDLTGKRFGLLTVIERTPDSPKNPKWLCVCDCGKESVVWGGNLRRGLTKSCGCAQALPRHGMARTAIYKAWHGMLQRCDNPSHGAYKHYGGRGISVCHRWRDFSNFIEDMGVRPDGLELDRIDNDGNYCKENCRWVTHKVNCQNTRRSIHAGG